MRKITNQDICKMNELYLQYHTYAAVARELGFAPTTVKRYIIPGYTPEAAMKIKHFDPDTDMPTEFSTKAFVGCDNWGELCVMDEDEWAEVRALQKEILV